MGKVNTFGFIVGVIAWILIMWYASTKSTCLKTNSCDGGDMVLFAIIGIGMLAPSWLVASIASVLFGSEE